MGKKLKPAEEVYILEFIPEPDATTKCSKCKRPFTPREICCNVIAPVTGKEPSRIKLLHFKCRTEQQHQSFTRIPAVHNVKGFSALPDAQQDIIRQKVAQSPPVDEPKQPDEDFPDAQSATVTTAADESELSEKEGDANDCQNRNQGAWAHFLVAAVHDAKLAACATADSFDRLDTEIEIRRLSRPYNLSVEDQACRIACLLSHCGAMSDDDIQVVARTFAAQIPRNKTVDREYRSLANIASRGEGRSMAYVLVHDHYRGRITKGDALYFRAHGEPATVYVYNAEWEQVGELSATSSTLLAPLLCQPRFKFTSFFRMGNIGGNGSYVYRVTRLPINISVENIRVAEGGDSDARDPTHTQVLGVLPSISDPHVRLVTVICPTIAELGGTFTLRWWPGDEDDCFLDFNGERTHDFLKLLYPDGTDLLSLEEEWELATGELLGAAERRYSVPVGSRIIICKRDDSKTIAILHTPSFV
ncbi:hypothetical protein EXIGLDRAFT_747908 [Exidia glandulosa HHB12029]|uniref:PARP-type domain-containing protein n=1 Tax=Exidia glandulosa HHB12029 TaxID=1314781 RepID=A0A165K8J4_EXIGL|nr:hypothetical protein EXIGLDRAFT_747908 [Exidia glandulosa HHB12029]